MVKLSPILLLPTAVVLATLLPGARGEEKDIPELNSEVRKFAEDYRGKQVGNGECWTLAADALTAAGAQRPGVKGVPVSVFGRELKRGEAILPGDVAQFEKAKFVHKTD